MTSGITAVFLKDNIVEKNHTCFSLADAFFTLQVIISELPTRISFFSRLFSVSCFELNSNLEQMKSLKRERRD